MTKTARQLQEEGLLYDVFEQELTDIKDRTYGLVSELSRVSHFDTEYVMSLVRKIVAKIGQDSYIVPPFRCDYGDHVFIGNNTYINYNCCFLDSAKVTIGDYVYMGPNCNIFTPCHPIHYELRKEKVTEYALPVTVGSHSWIGGDVVITPGVTIGENCVIGAGSVVTKDIPDNSIAVGNPCKVIRQVNDKDREYINSLILDDETKDSKYKQENGYVYSAKDEAIFNIVKDTVHYVEILNKLSNSEIQRRRDFLRTFVAKLDEGAMINSPFYMEFVNHLEMGVNSFINYDCIMLNNAIKLGDNVLVGPKVSFYTAIHPIDAKQREQWLVYAKPITVEDNVWIGGGSIILGGITIGFGSVVGAGSVVTKSIPAGCVAAGNPCRIIRRLEPGYKLRKIEGKDIPELQALFRNTVLIVNSKDYTQEEVEDWASCGDSIEHWKELLSVHNYVAALDQDGHIIGFSSMNTEGYLHSMFVHKDWQHKGVASMLLSEVEKMALGYGVHKISAEVSITARPFFEKHGYKMVKEQKAKANRLYLTNYVMKKELNY